MYCSQPITAHPERKAELWLAERCTFSCQDRTLCKSGCCRILLYNGFEHFLTSGMSWHFALKRRPSASFSIIQAQEAHWTASPVKQSLLCSFYCQTAFLTQSKVLAKKALFLSHLWSLLSRWLSNRTGQVYQHLQDICNILRAGNERIAPKLAKMALSSFFTTQAQKFWASFWISCHFQFFLPTLERTENDLHNLIKCLLWGILLTISSLQSNKCFAKLEVAFLWDDNRSMKNGNVVAASVCQAKNGRRNVALLLIRAGGTILFVSSV